jgi:hypothetical protein
MTLNFVAVTPKHVYQCSDFRLTYDKVHRTDHEAQKIVAISSHDWNALLQFTGAAKMNNGFDTSKWLADLASSVSMGGKVSLDEVIRKLREAEKYIRYSEDHSFTLAGFAKSRPFLYLVSNFQRLPDTRASIRKRKWEVTKTIQRRVVIATGSTTHLNPDDLRKLRNLARKLCPKVTHQKLAELNKAIAVRMGPDGPVSQSCMTGHLGLDGQGWLIPHNVHPGGEYLPKFAMNLIRGHLQLIPKVDESGNPLPRRLVQIALNRQGDKYMMACEFQADGKEDGDTP